MIPRTAAGKRSFRPRPRFRVTIPLVSSGRRAVLRHAGLAAFTLASLLGGATATAVGDPDGTAVTTTEVPALHPSATASPRDDLVDGDLVAFTAVDFSAGESVPMGQCAYSPGVRDSVSCTGRQDLVADAEGRVNGSIRVVRTFESGSNPRFVCFDGETVDTPGEFEAGCFLGIGGVGDSFPHVIVDLTFASGSDVSPPVDPSDPAVAAQPTVRGPDFTG